MRQLDLAGLHEAIAAAVPDRECLVWRDRRLTWHEVTERTRRLARVLHAHGLGTRSGSRQPWTSAHDHLALYLHNGPEYLEGLLAAHKARVAPFNVNYRYVDDELAYLFGDARPAAIIYHARFAEPLSRILDRLERSPLLLLHVADESGAQPLPGALDYEAALAAASTEPLDVRPSAHDLHILYTGGTTGMPKGVLWRIGDLLNGPLGLRRRDGTPITDLAEAVEPALAARHRVLIAPPLMHGTGTWSALGGWRSGATVVIPDRVDRLDAGNLLSVASRERVTRLTIVGDAFARPIADELGDGSGSYDLSELRQILNSGASISPQVKQRLLAALPTMRITDVLGSSESGFQVARQGAEDLPFTAAPGTAVLSADRTRVLTPGEDELGWLAKTGATPLGYLGDPEKTAATFITVGAQRFVVAGDRARLLADGTVEVHGRESTTISTGGEKVFAEEVENVLRGVPGVADALVIGRPSERWGHEIVAVVRLSADRTEDELRSACAPYLARYKLPKAFLRTDRILRLANGKADYAVAQAIVASATNTTNAAANANAAASTATAEETT
ncbi:AMP-binding protein [Actinomadura sp. HBU206391]|uniref:AMP-binding protein n=1 Tax=Actinomadura sp. HBU206391 TaxID=2731692 RepID=UPI00164F6766|nr:AMP-binding protein [Actinomadura sp. HBU206391]MBC6460370.1 AMP-binding protein [Actinomadura sp. HBU206391]